VEADLVGIEAGICEHRRQRRAELRHEVGHRAKLQIGKRTFTSGGLTDISTLPCIGSPHGYQST
jgi:hypothetical protein